MWLCHKKYGAANVLDVSSVLGDFFLDLAAPDPVFIGHHFRGFDAGPGSSPRQPQCSHAPLAIRPPTRPHYARRFGS
jgi:hypothetical protein